MRSHSIPKLFVLLLAAILVGCSATPQAAATPTARVAALTPTPCPLEPIAVPTRPAYIPGYAELDPATGLHITGIAPEVDLGTYRLEVTGAVDSPLSLTYDDLRCMPKIELRCTLVCPGFFEDEASWAGVPLNDILERAGAQPNAAGIRLYSADGYATLVTLPLPSPENSFLAYEWEGEPLPILHGFPVRAVFPELGGSAWAKWLVKIEVLGADALASSDPETGPGGVGLR